MIRFVLLCALCVFVVSLPAQKKEDPASADLARALAEAAQGPLELIQALEAHLKKFPSATRRLAVYRAIFKASSEINDEARVVEYGEKILAENQDDLQLLELVARLLLGRDRPAAAARAARYADALLAGLARQGEDRAPKQVSEARRQYERDRNLARGRLLRGSALLESGQNAMAREDLETSWALAPTGEAAERLGEMEEKLGRPEAAIARYVDAFAIADPRQNAVDKQRLRRKLAGLYRASGQPESDLGAHILAAYDRLAVGQAARTGAFQPAGVNARRSNPFDFELKRPGPGENTSTVRLADFLGKVIVVDFWATWCAPCREQHPLLEKIEEKYGAKGQVVFLSINADDDPAAVKPFLQTAKWRADVLLDDGLARYYEVDAIPTLIIFNRKGQIAYREPGFQPFDFVKNLSSRIEEALNSGPASVP